jgi:short-subunit dehydrogenase
MADVHVSATIALCSAASPGMGRRKTGSIVVVSSIAAWMAGAGSVTYGATKSFQAVFAQALARELGPLGVRVQALCPGYTRSEFHDTPEYAHWSRDSVPRIFWSTPDFVARESWKALGKTVVFLPGRLNRLLVAVGGSAPGVRLREMIRRSRK